MTDAKNQHKQTIVLDPANQTVVPYAVPPELSQFRTAKRLSDASRIAQLSHSVAQELQDTVPVLRVKLEQISLGRFRELNVPSYGASERP